MVKLDYGNFSEIADFLNSLTAQLTDAKAIEMHLHKPCKVSKNSVLSV